eukprot:scaffold289_cov147-Amphora_coffeaeformis.AAC.5
MGAGGMLPNELQNGKEVLIEGESAVEDVAVASRGLLSLLFEDDMIIREWRLEMGAMQKDEKLDNENG